MSSPIDPLGALPPELFLQVIAELEPYAVWGLRRVSKQYNRILRDEGVVQEALCRYETHGPTDCARTGIGTTEERLEILKAHHSGVPVAELRLQKLSFSRLGHVSIPPIMKGRFLAFGRRFDCLTVIDLITGKSYDYALRDKVQRIVLTATTLAYASRNKLFFCPLPMLGQRAKRIYVEDIHGRMDGDRDSLAGQDHLILIYRHFGTQVTVINTLTSQISNVEVPSIESPWREVTMQMTNNMCLIVFTYNGDTTLADPVTRANVIQLNFTEALDYASQSQLELKDIDDDTYQDRITLQRTGCPGQLFLSLGFWCQYLNDRQSILPSWTELRVHAQCLWKDKAYAAILGPPDGFNIIAVQQLGSSRPTRYILVPVDVLPHQILVNESFLVCYYRGLFGDYDCMKVYTFDPASTSVRTKPLVDVGTALQHGWTKALSEEVMREHQSAARNMPPRQFDGDPHPAGHSSAGSDDVPQNGDDT